MPTVTFTELMTSDIQDVFLNGETSHVAVYTTGVISTDINVQFFEDSLDKMDTLYQHAWCDFADMPNLIENEDKLEISGVSYIIMESTPDEFQQGLNLFLQKEA